MKTLLLLGIAAIACMPGFAQRTAKFSRQSLSVVVSSPDYSHSDVKTSQYVTVACRTARADTTGFSISVTYLSKDGARSVESASIPRLPDSIVLFPVQAGVTAEKPWTTFTFYLPTSVEIVSVSVEERSAPASFAVGSTEP